IETVRSSTSTVIVAFISDADMDVLLKEFSRANLTGYQWVGTEAWIFDFQSASRDNKRILDGAIGLSIPKANVSGLKEFILDVKPLYLTSNDLFVEFWEALFSCKVKQSEAGETQRLCTGHENLTGVENSFTDMSLMPMLSNMYKGVYAVAHALHNILGCNKACNNKLPLDPLTILQHIKRIHFKTKEGEEVYFDENGDPAAKYEIINWQPRENGPVSFVSVGLYDASLPADEQMNVQEKSVVFAQNSKQVPVSACSEKCPPGTHKVLQKGKPVCCYDCISCAEGEISNSTDEEVTDNTLNSTKILRYGKNKMKFYAASVLGFTLIQVIICILWLSISPPFPSKNFEGFKDKIIWECALGSAVGFWAVLGYIGFLAVLCFICAFLARKLPDNFNEAKFITFSMLIFCAVWITFIPAYVSSPGKFSVAVEIFAILASSFGLLFCIFIPKCYIMLIKP
uniref:G-protein coupled receptors family 3 profile domain-containing protein n=1 Tax=Poecilia formosa TaxID=48698 RepID=A0A096M2W7_POEFO